MKYNGPKVRLSRRLGIALTPKAQQVMEAKPYPPGEHGQKRQRRSSVYQQQLREKQRLRMQYNVSERQLRTYVKRAMRRSGNTVDRLAQQLETRLDALVLHAGMARTIYAARQLVGHGHIFVNGRRVDIPSYQVRVGETFGVRPGSQNIPQVVEQWQDSVGLPSLSYLEISRPDLSATLTALPQRDDIPAICEVSQVIEFYSR